MLNCGIDRRLFLIAEMRNCSIAELTEASLLKSRNPAMAQFRNVVLAIQQSHNSQCIPVSAIRNPQFAMPLLHLPVRPLDEGTVAEDGRGDAARPWGQPRCSVRPRSRRATMARLPCWARPLVATVGEGSTKTKALSAKGQGSNISPLALSSSPSARGEVRDQKPTLKAR